MILYRYILKAHLGPFLFSFFTIFFLFLFQFLIKALDQLVGKGLSLWIIFQLIAYNLAWIVTLAAPMAVLVATLMAFGSLSSDNEITIMKAGGISLPRLMAPVIIAAVILSYLMVRFNNDILPEANHKARVLLTDISKTKPTFILEPGKFSDDIGGFKILVKKTFENNNNLEDIYISDYSNPVTRNVITAEKGDISFTSDFNHIVMNLTNGEIHQLNNLDYTNKYRVVKFDKHRIIMDAKGFGFQQSGENAFSRGDRELSSYAMNRIVDSLRKSSETIGQTYLNRGLPDIKNLIKIVYKDTTYKAPPPVPFAEQDTSRKNFASYDSLKNLTSRILSLAGDFKNSGRISKDIEKQIDQYDVEIYKKYSIPFACVVFALIGAPLGYRVRKGGFGIAAGLSLLFFLLYWASLIGGEKFADRALLSPLLGMWAANIVLGVFGLVLMKKSS
ncbi:MAG: LptF/LptG family permease [Ignavibacteria bacterium]|nr:LptF/LptG family permease [Ignavibacteria bacterium]